MDIQLKENSTVVIYPLEDRSGTEQKECLVISGDKIKFTLYNEGSGSVSLVIKDTFSKDIPTRVIKTLEQSGPGFQDYVLNDFHSYLVLELISTGSNKTSVGVTIKKDVESGVFSTQEQINELNRLVPKFYDDAQVLAETPKKQPTLIQFRAKGVVIRTIEITYVNEIFNRVKIL